MLVLASASTKKNDKNRDHLSDATNNSITKCLDLLQ